MIEHDEELEEDNLCNTCHGTGEGRTSETSCSSCKGSGRAPKIDYDSLDFCEIDYWVDF